MPDLDNLLQQKLIELENGRPLEDVLASLPEAAVELIPLLQVAASVRAMPQPAPDPSLAEAGRQKVLEAARDATLPAITASETSPTRPHAAARPAAAGPWQQLHSLRSQPRFWVAALAGVFLAVLLVTGGLAWYLSSPRGAEAAALMDVSGIVEVASADQAADWKPVKAGDTIHTGQRIRTGDGSGATLVFYEGTRSIIGPNADLTLSVLEGGAGKQLRVLVDQYAGRTDNSVVPFSGKNSSFVVNTPNGSASVHGTRFDVEIGQGGQTRFAVERGRVLVYNEVGQVFVGAGQVARARLDETLTSPAYQFSLQGPVEAIDGSAWTVQGVSFLVSEQTSVNGNFTIGSQVSVEGHLEGGARTADTINPAADETTLAAFTGRIERMDGDVWQIDGSAVVVNRNTTRPDNLRVGDTVRVTFGVQNGQWTALKIEALGEQPGQPTPTPSSTPDANANPRLVFTPDEVETSGCSPQYTLTGALANTATGAGDYAADVQLGYVITRGGAYVEGVELSPAGWARIEPGQPVTFSLKVIPSPAYQVTTGNQKQIKLRVFIANEANRPDLLDATLTAVIVNTCKQGETGTPVSSATPSLTPPVTPTLPGSATPGANTTCTGANPHPQGLRLAQRYNVSYEEIMGWFCQNFGFGEIDLAYSLSQQSGKPVAEIFAMRRTGLGWGEIKKQLAGSNPQPGNGNPPGKGPKAKPTKKPKP